MRARASRTAAGAGGRAFSWICASALVLGGATAVAHAQYEARAEVERPIASGTDEDPTAASSEVPARDRPRALEPLDELLLEVPGARTRRLGTLGAFSALSLRGAETVHTSVVLGDVPLDSVDGGAFDLSVVPVSLIDRVEVYRGGAPVWLGAGAIGGVVRLVPRHDALTMAEASLGAGSFGLVDGHLAASVARGATTWTAVVAAARDTGDFEYRDDGGTAFDPSDDRDRRRANGQTARAAALVRLETRAFGGTVEVIGLGLERAGGVPGPAIQPTVRTRRSEVRLLGAFRWRKSAPVPAPTGHDEPRWRLELGASLGWERTRFSDVLGEIGMLRRQTDDRSVRGSVRAAGAVRTTRWLSVVGVATVDDELVEPSDALARVTVGSSRRRRFAGALEARLHGRVLGLRAELRPSARLEVLSSSLIETRPERAGEPADAVVLAPTARLGAVVEPLTGLALSASIATSTRAPTLLELFGDRAFLLGDTRLSPERSIAAEVGAVARGRAGILRGSAELRAFWLSIADMIVYVRTSQLTASPQNLKSAAIMGGELGVRGALGRHVRLAGSVTLLDARGGDDRVLPLRPRVQAYARPELVSPALGPIDAITLFGEVTHVGGNFVDVANLVALDARTQLGAGVAITGLGRRLELAVTVRDLLDARGTDVLGFPLPGRSLAVTLTGREEQAP